MSGGGKGGKTLRRFARRTAGGINEKFNFKTCSKGERYLSYITRVFKKK